MALSFKKALALVALLSGVSQANTVIVSTAGTIFDRGTAFQTAISSADCGDLIVLTTGYTYSTPNIQTQQFVMPYKNTANCNAGQWLSIESSDLAALPAGVRVSSNSAVHMPTISVYATGGYAIFFSAKSQFYRFRGIQFTADVNVNTTEGIVNGLITEETSDPKVGLVHDIEFDRCLFRPPEWASQASDPYRSVSAGIYAEGINYTVKNSFFQAFEGARTDHARIAISSGTAGSPAIVYSTHTYTLSQPWAWVYIWGATGDWSRINGYSEAFLIDATHFRPAKWVRYFTKASNVVNVSVMYNRPHNFQVGDSVSVEGFNGNGGGGNLNLNGVKTVLAAGTTWFQFADTDPTILDGIHCATADTSCLYQDTGVHLGVTWVSSSTGPMTGAVMQRQEDPHNSFGLTIASSNGPFHIINNYIEGWYSAFFTGGAGIPAASSATATSVTGYSAVLDNVGGIRIGEVISIDTPYTNHYLRGHRNVTVQTIVGNTITFKGIGPGRLANEFSDWDSGTCNTSGTAVTFIGFGAGDSGGGGNGPAVYYQDVPVVINGVTYTMTNAGGAHTATLTSSAGTQTGVPCHIAMLPSEGGAVGWRGTPGPILDMRGNSFHKVSWGQLTSRLCKSQYEMKAADGGIVDGNINTGDTCIPMGFTMHNQTGYSPWSSFRDLRYSNNLAYNTGAFAIISEMDDYLATVVQATNVPVGFEYGNKGGLVDNNVFMDHNFATVWPQLQLYTDANIWVHNTVKRDQEPISQSMIVMAGCPYNSAMPALCNQSVVRDNIMSQGLYGVDSTYWPTYTTSFSSNVLIDDWGVGYPPINTYAVPSWASLNPPGTCDGLGNNWLNCVDTVHTGLASDGGTPGADVKQVNDHINRWSENAGLITFYALAEGGGWYNTPSAFTIVPGSATVSWTRVNGSGSCNMRLYTDKTRQTLHADTANGGLQACTRSGNTNVGQNTTFKLGNNSALSPSTNYYYEIDDGSNLMTGTFFTPSSSAKSISSLTPNVGMPTLGYNVAITGTNTSFQGGLTKVSFGPNMQTQAVYVTDPTHLTAIGVVLSTAPAGPTTVTATTNSEVVTGTFNIGSTSSYLGGISGKVSITGKVTFQ